MRENRGFRIGKAVDARTEQDVYRRKRNKRLCCAGMAQELAHNGEGGRLQLRNHVDGNHLLSEEPGNGSAGE